MSGRNRCGKEGCDRVRSAPIHVFGLLGYEHPFEDTRPTGISPVGQRMRRFNASPAGQEYRAHARELGKGETPCQIQSPVCIGVAQHIHEDKTRGKSGGLDAAIRKGTRLWDACDPCNAYCSENQVWAREKGFIVSAREIDRGEMEIEI
jgi:hypothetical protein